MPSDRTLITVAELVNRAVDVVDPTGADPAVAEFAARYEDEDAPVRGVLEQLPELIRWGADEHPPVVVAQAIVLYLGHRLDQFDDDPESLLRLVARAEFEERAEPPVAQWFAEHGVEGVAATP